MPKPITTDGINYTLLGCLVYALDDNDKIRDTDFIRELVETGDSGGFDTSYCSEAWQGTKWHTCKQDFSGWIGNTYADFMIFAERDSRTHEIIRVVPDSVRFELEIKGELPTAGKFIKPS